MARKTAGAAPASDEPVPALPAYTWGYLPHDLGRVVNALNLQLMHSLRPIGLTIPQFRVMQFLQQVESTSISGICELTLIEQSVVSRIVNQLEERGFARRARNPRNARMVDVSLTPLGKVVLESLTPAARQIVDATLQALSAREQKQLTELLERLYRSTAALGGPGAQDA
jgi:DNA-binding MarR family transcriptional regulator